MQQRKILADRAETSTVCLRFALGWTRSSFENYRAQMSSYPPLKLSRLRDIGWREWDPIGLLPQGDAWESYPEFADEYFG